MALKFTVESFLNLVRQSRLVEADRLDGLLAQFQADGVDASNSQAVCDALVAAGALTDWQADKLLKGKHKGFFLGKYRLQSLLGKGGMSSVYLADHVLMRRNCAIKVLPHKRVNDTSYLERFHREAQAVASLDHPNIVRAYDVDREVDGSTEIHFLVMEYVEGSSLQELVIDNGPREYREAAEYVRQAALGLSHAHDAGLVHRDIKPANLLVDVDGVVKILDLGLARFFEETDENPITLRHDERVLGTADYLAPEQALDSHQADARADVYSLGCTFYFLLTGHPPFNEGTLAQRLMWHQTRTPPPIANDRPDLPARLAEIAETMMHKSVDDRYQTAAEVSTQISNWLGDRPSVPVAEPIAPVAQPVRPPAEPPAAPAEPIAPVAQPVRPPAEPPAPVVPPAEPVGQPLARAEDDSGNRSDAAAGGEEDGLANFLSGLGDETAAPAGSAAVTDPPAPPPENISPPFSPATMPPVLDESPAVAEVDSPVTGPTVVPGPSGPAAAQDTSFPVLDTSVAPTSGERSAPRARSPRRRRQPKSGAGRGRLIAIAGVALVFLIGGAFVLGPMFSSSPSGGDKKTAKGPVDDDDGQGTAKKAGNKKKSKKKGAVAAKLSKTLEVGPAAKFKTIAAALNYVYQNRDGYRGRKSRRLKVTINVAGGHTYAESIVIDNAKKDKKASWPEGIAILSTGAILAPAGAEPVVRLNQVEFVKIEGFQIEAGGKPTAIVLRGAQDRVELSKLVVSGFSKSGIHAQGVAGDPGQDHLQLNDLRMISGGAEAVGLLMSEGEYDTTANVDVRRCRLVGPMATGLSFAAHASTVMVQETVVQAAKIGVLFAGENRTWRNLTLRNNTFYQVERGLVFEQLPGESSDGVSFKMNLFAEQQGPECIVEKGYNELKFSQMVSTGIRDNWSTRTKVANPKSGERELMLPALERQRGVKVEFSSTDPAAADFMEPLSGGLPSRGGGNLDDPRFVGARAFRTK